MLQTPKTPIVEKSESDTKASDVHSTVIRKSNRNIHSQRTSKVPDEPRTGKALFFANVLADR